jgi:hypothetical protein
MDVLLREIREQSGAQELHDTELSVAELSIGSASNQSVQLLGQDVAPRHAIIKLTSTGAVIECLRGQRITVDGEPRSSGSLQSGAVIELGGHQLTLVRAPLGFDLALEVRRNTNVAASEFEGAFRTDLDQTWLSKRFAAWVLAVATVLVFGLGPLLVVLLRSDDVEQASPQFMPSDGLWSSGPLTPAHQLAAGDRCDVCHQKLFERVQDNACQSCHETTHDHIPAATLAHTSLEPTERCATCHREHKEPASFLVSRDDSGCTECHANSTQHFPSLDIQPVTGFDAKRHPEFQAHLLKQVKQPIQQNGLDATFEWAVEIAALADAQEQSNLKFSHTQHLDPAKVLRTSDSAALGCADCHRLSADGEHFERITMQASCASCHELTFDPGAPERQLPHGKPREVVQTLQDYFTRKFADPTPAIAAVERRRIPGHDAQEETCTGPVLACAQRSAAREAENQFARRGCVSCHDVLDTQSNELVDRYRVSPVRLTSDYFPVSHFSHRSHRVQGKLTGDAACQSCHAAKPSASSADLLVPGIENCTQCHSEPKSRFTRASMMQIKLECVSCHAYHPRSVATANASSTGNE